MGSDGSKEKQQQDEPTTGVAAAQQQNAADGGFVDEDDEKEYQRMKRFFDHYIPGEKTDAVIKQAVIKHRPNRESFWKYMHKKYGPEEYGGGGDGVTAADAEGGSAVNNDANSKGILTATGGTEETGGGDAAAAAERGGSTAVNDGGNSNNNIPPTGTETTNGNDKTNQGTEDQEAQMFSRLRRFYDHYAPGEKTDDELRTERLDRFRGNYAEMWSKLEGKYGPEANVPAAAAVGSGNSTTTGADGTTTAAERNVPATGSTKNHDAIEHHTTNTLTNSSSSTAVTDEQQEKRDKARLMRFHQKYVPSRVGDEDAVLEQFKAKREKLWKQLVDRYGPEPPEDFVPPPTATAHRKAADATAGQTAGAAASGNRTSADPLMTKMDPFSSSSPLAQPASGVSHNTNVQNPFSAPAPLNGDLGGGGGFARDAEGDIIDPLAAPAAAFTAPMSTVSTADEADTIMLSRVQKFFRHYDHYHKKHVDDELFMRETWLEPFRGSYDSMWAQLEDEYGPEKAVYERYQAAVKRSQLLTTRHGGGQVHNNDNTTTVLGGGHHGVDPFSADDVVSSTAAAASGGDAAATAVAPRRTDSTDTLDMSFVEREQQKEQDEADAKMLQRLRRFYDHYIPGQKTDEELRTERVERFRGNYAEMWATLERRHGPEANVPAAAAAGSGNSTTTGAVPPTTDVSSKLSSQHRTLLQNMRSGPGGLQTIDDLYAPLHEFPSYNSGPPYIFELKNKYYGRSNNDNNEQAGSGLSPDPKKSSGRGTTTTSPPQGSGEFGGTNSFFMEQTSHRQHNITSEALDAYGKPMSSITAADLMTDILGGTGGGGGGGNNDAMVEEERVDINLNLRCEGLKKADWFGLSDPYAVLYRKRSKQQPTTSGGGAGSSSDGLQTQGSSSGSSGSGSTSASETAAQVFEEEIIEVGRTSIIEKNLNPVWPDVVPIQVRMTVGQAGNNTAAASVISGVSSGQQGEPVIFFTDDDTLFIKVWDDDGDHKTSSPETDKENDYLGEVNVPLSDLLIFAEERKQQFEEEEQQQKKMSSSSEKSGNGNDVAGAATTNDNNPFANVGSSAVQEATNQTAAEVLETNENENGTKQKQLEWSGPLTGRGDIFITPNIVKRETHIVPAPPGAAPHTTSTTVANGKQEPYTTLFTIGRGDFLLSDENEQQKSLQNQNNINLDGDHHFEMNKSKHHHLSYPDEANGGNVLSRIHCKFVFEVATRTPYLIDSSTNGTYHNGTLVGQGNRVRLRNGDIISLANSPTSQQQLLQSHQTTQHQQQQQQQQNNNNQQNQKEKVERDASIDKFTWVFLSSESMFERLRKFYDYYAKPKENKTDKEIGVERIEKFRGKYDEMWQVLEDKPRLKYGPEQRVYFYPAESMLVKTALAAEAKEKRKIEEAEAAAAARLKSERRKKEKKAHHEVSEATAAARQMKKEKEEREREDLLFQKMLEAEEAEERRRKMDIDEAANGILYGGGGGNSHRHNNNKHPFADDPILSSTISYGTGGTGTHQLGGDNNNNQPAITSDGLSVTTSTTNDVVVVAQRRFGATADPMEFEPVLQVPPPLLPSAAVPSFVPQQQKPIRSNNNNPLPFPMPKVSRTLMVKPPAPSQQQQQQQPISTTSSLPLVQQPQRRRRKPPRLTRGRQTKFSAASASSSSSSAAAATAHQLRQQEHNNNIRHQQQQLITNHSNSNNKYRPTTHNNNNSYFYGVDIGSGGSGSGSGSGSEDDDWDGGGGGGHQDVLQEGDDFQFMGMGGGMASTKNKHKMLIDGSIHGDGRLINHLSGGGLGLNLNSTATATTLATTTRGTTTTNPDFVEYDENDVEGDDDEPDFFLEELDNALLAVAARTSSATTLDGTVPHPQQYQPPHQQHHPNAAAYNRGVQQKYSGDYNIDEHVSLSAITASRPPMNDTLSGPFTTGHQHPPHYNPYLHRTNSS